MGIGSGEAKQISLFQNFQGKQTPLGLRRKLNCSLDRPDCFLYPLRRHSFVITVISSLPLILILLTAIHKHLHPMTSTIIRDAGKVIKNGVAARESNRPCSTICSGVQQYYSLLKLQSRKLTGIAHCSPLISIPKKNNC